MHIIKTPHLTEPYPSSQSNRISRATNNNIAATYATYFNQDVAPHVADARTDASKCDSRDGEVGIVGYEIPFNRHFYQYEPPRDLAEIDADLDVLSKEIMDMLREVHS